MLQAADPAANELGNLDCRMSTFYENTNQIYLSRCEQSKRALTWPFGASETESHLATMHINYENIRGSITPLPGVVASQEGPENASTAYRHARLDQVPL